MDVLLREIKRRADGRTEYVDTEISADSLDIGASADRTVQVLGAGVAALHAELRRDGAKLVVAAVGRARIVVDGSPVRRRTLDVGSEFAIGGHRFAVREAPAGFDVLLELTRDETVEPSAYEAAFRTDLADTWLSKRRAAWLLLALVLVTTLIAPLALRERGARIAHRWYVPDDVQWSSGPLAPAHALAVGDKCASCHTDLFARVPSKACTTCHDRVGDHVPVASRDREIAATAAHHSGMSTDRCASCHREHDEPSSLIVTADALCEGCHASEQSRGAPGAPKVHAATGFAAATHPHFNAHLLAAARRNSGTGFAFDWGYRVAPVATAREASNLKFPHAVHLDPEKVRSNATSKQLGCSDCHVLSADKLHFEPITMEKHCRSCHDLEFDETDPGRQLPHGQPLEAVLAIEGHFLKKLSDPHAAQDEHERRRLPDREVVEERCTASAYECAERKTLDEAINQFTKRGCVTCHVVDDNGNRDVYSRFQVVPIRLVANYFPEARFPHSSHATMKEKTGDAACVACHKADQSKESADLLVPDVENCAECHGDRSVADRLTVGCIDCHTYHPDAELQSARAETASL